MRLKFALAVVIWRFSLRRRAPSRRVARCATRRLPRSGQAGQRSLDYRNSCAVTPALILFLTVMFMLYRRASFRNRIISRSWLSVAQASACDFRSCMN